MAARKKQAPHMTEDDKRFIYQVLKRNFEFDEEYPLANLGWCFLREDIDKADYGFIKLTPMLEEMSDFVSTSAKEVGGVSQSMFSLRENNAYEQKQDKKSGSKKKNESNFRQSPASDAESTKASSKKKGACRPKDADKIEDKFVEKAEGESRGESADKNADAPEPTHAGKTEDVQEKGKQAAQKSTNAAPVAKADEKAATAKRASSQPAAKPKEEESVKASKPLTRSSRLPRGRVAPGKALERFADLKSWPEFLSTLASLALEEPWDFCEVPGIQAVGGSSKRYDILHNYIRYTFYRLTLEDKVAFSDDESFAAFNTGLVDKHYEDIYACFEPSPAESRQPWTFAGFCTAGTGRFGKRLVREMNPLPQPASYLQRKEDLLFDLEREVVCDIRHIVVDNVHRLPLIFLRDEMASSAECRGILAGIEDLTPRGRDARFERLRKAIADDPRLFTRLSNSINAAIDQARRQVRWNYKTAVPAYYPRTNSMNLLLPLNLTEDTTPDVALVVELQKSGNYQGQTIVTMAQAYRDARLLCRPYIDWLSPASIIDAAGEDDDEEE